MMLDVQRLIAVFAGIACLVGSAQSACQATADKTTETAKADELVITIAGPAGSGSEDARPIALNIDESRLTVVIRNASKRNLKLWNENNSSGYDNLTLEIYSVDGNPLQKSIVVARHIEAWFSNMISSCELAPGDCIVRDVRFARTKPRTLGEEWFYWGLPISLDRVQFPHVLGMRAVFRSQPTYVTAGTSRFADIWIGTSTSARHDYKIETYSAPVETSP